jgi:hypothetical protein
VHPAITFTGTSIDLRQLRDAFAAVTAPAAVPIAQALAVELGCEPVVVAERSRRVRRGDRDGDRVLGIHRRPGGAPAAGGGGECARRFLTPLVHSTVDRALIEAGDVLETT